MQFFSKLGSTPWQRPQGPLSMTIGNFDGVHLGHRALLARTVNWANTNQGFSLVLTFDPHPMQIFAPEKQFARLFDKQDQRDQLHAAGVGGVFVQAFTRDFSDLSPQEFLQDFLLAQFSPQHLAVGHDFEFGKKRAGNISMLQKFCQEKKIQFESVVPFSLGNEIVSSSAIRKSLQNADPEHAKEMLGRPFYLRGTVVKGAQRGQTIGFPTANLNPTVQFCPAPGVYATKTRVSAGKNPGIFSSVTNVGFNPTVSERSDRNVKIETHIFSFSEVLYGESIEVEFHHFLRPEKKFANLEELKIQIRTDVQEAQNIFQKNDSEHGQ